MTINKLTPNVLTDDMNRTLAFYRDLLGFEVVINVPDQAPFAWCLLKLGAAEIMFQSRASLSEELPLFEKVLSGGALTFYVDVSNVKQLAGQLKGKVEVLKDLNTTFYGATEFTVRDCNGQILTFAQRENSPD